MAQNKPVAQSRTANDMRLDEASAGLIIVKLMGSTIALQSNFQQVRVYKRSNTNRQHNLVLGATAVA